MIINASAGRGRKASVTTAVTSLTLKAENGEEAVWLAALTKTLTPGGSLRIALTGHEPIDLRFSDDVGDEPKEVTT